MVESPSRGISTTRLSDLDGLDRVYRQQAPRMWRALTAYSGSRDVAEDAVAEAFAQAMVRVDSVRSPERWVWKAAYRIAAGELKRRGSLTELVVDGPVSVDEPTWEIRAALASCRRCSAPRWCCTTTRGIQHRRLPGSPGRRPPPCGFI